MAAAPLLKCLLVLSALDSVGATSAVLGGVVGDDDGCTAGTGCFFDFELVWGTLSPPPPSPPPPPPDETYDSYGVEVEKCEAECEGSTCPYCKCSCLLTCFQTCP